MTNLTTRRIGALALVAAVAVGACSSGAAPRRRPARARHRPAPPRRLRAPPRARPDRPGSIVIDGSSTVLPISEAAAEDFNAANPGVDISVKESGTGGGFTKFCAGETDINDASRPIKADDAKEGAACTANGVTYVQLQVAIDGLTVVVNPANTWATCMTLEQLKTIYGPDSPENLTWNQVDPSWPNEPVVRSMPGADSGTFDYFTEVVNGEVDASTSHAQQSEDDNVLVSTVAGNPNAISYFGYAYYLQNNTKVKAVAIDGGDGLHRADTGDHRRRDIRAAQPARCSSIRTPPRPRSRRRSTSSSTSTWPMPPPWRPSRPSAMWPSRMLVAAEQVADWTTAVPQ